MWLTNVTAIVQCKMIAMAMEPAYPRHRRAPATTDGGRQPTSPFTEQLIAALGLVLADMRGLMYHRRRIPLTRERSAQIGACAIDHQVCAHAS